jgi:hypothetical protein
MGKTVMLSLQSGSQKMMTALLLYPLAQAVWEVS